MKSPQIIICIGQGGVGKTTVSSVIALQQAKLGKKTLVLTIDPAKRLWETLGLSGAISGRPAKVDLKKVLGLEPKSDGQLFALMPDLKTEWMSFLNSAINRSESVHEISENHFYQYMVDGLPGSLEIICSHILYTLIKKNDFDVIVLDTPPLSNSLSFFESPQKIIEVLEHNAFRLFAKTQKSLLARLTKKVALFSSSILEKTLEKLIGSHFLSEVIDFAITIDAIYEPLKERALAMDSMLKSPKTTYVLVDKARENLWQDTKALALGLNKKSIKLSEIIINQKLFSFSGSALLAEKKWWHKAYVEETKLQNKMIEQVKNNTSLKIIELDTVKPEQDKILPMLLKNYERNINENISN